MWEKLLYAAVIIFVAIGMVCMIVDGVNKTSVPKDPKPIAKIGNSTIYRIYDTEHRRYYVVAVPD